MPDEHRAAREGVGARASSSSNRATSSSSTSSRSLGDGPLVLDIRIDREVRLQSGRLEFLKEDGQQGQQIDPANRVTTHTAQL